MVSNVLGITPEELIRRLRELRDTAGSDADYQRLRADLPEDWPV